MTPSSLADVPYIDRHSQTLRHWQQLNDESTETAVSPSHVLSLLESLADFHGRPFLTHWQTDLPAPARAMMLTNADDNGRSHLITVTANGRVTLYAPADDNQWQPAASAPLPADAGPPVAIENIYFDYEQIEIPHIVTRNRDGRSGDQLYELVFTPPNHLQLNLRTLRKASHRLAAAYRTGPEQPDGLTAVIATREADIPAALRPTGHRYQLPLDISPVALAHTADRVWAADNLERIWCWQWDGRTLAPDPDWPEQGLALDGQITALTLWPAADGQWLLLAATDTRQIVIIDQNGRFAAPIPTRRTVTALTPLPEQGQLFAADTSSRLCLIQPIWPPLAAAPLPDFSAVIARLPAAEQTHLLQDWLANGSRHQAAAAARAAAEAILAGDSRAADLLALVNHRQPIPVLAAVLEAIEPFALAQTDVESPLIRAVFQLARALYPHADVQLRRLIHLHTARLAAHFGEAVHRDPDYAWLSNARRHGEETQTQTYCQQAQTAVTPTESIAAYRNALDLYARRLIHRRQIAWLFAANHTIRALAPLPEQRALIATGAGDVHLIALDRRRHIETVNLPCKGIPRLILTGQLTPDGPEMFAIATIQGNLYTGPLQEDNCLAAITDANQLGCHIWGAAFVPPAAGQPPRLVVSSDNGRLHLFRQSDNDQWVEQQTMSSNIYKVHALTVTQVTPQEPPLILVGGTQANGGGALCLLSLDGRSRYPAMTFSGPVMDIQTVRGAKSGEKMLAVACRDGFIHLMRPSGSRLWSYRAGLAARSLAVGDMDNDGRDEIIVGSENNGNAILIFNISGAIRWHIPTEKPVVHIAAVPPTGAKPPQLLVADLNRTLRVIELNPPGSLLAEAVTAQAEACRRQWASHQGITDADLSFRWLTRPPTDALRGYAFLLCSREAGAGAADMLERLLQAQVDDSAPVVQHAYGQALIQTALHADKETAVTVITHLQTLANRGRPLFPVIVAALRELALADAAANEALTRWLPFFTAAAAQPDTAVKRAALYAVRAFGRVNDDAESAFWQLLPALAAETDDGPNQEDAAALLRDMAAGSNTALWLLAHQAVTQTDSADLLRVLGRLDSPLLNDTGLAAMLGGLGDMMYVSEPEEARRRFSWLAERVTAVTWDGPAANTPLMRAYQLLSQAMRLADYHAWQQFVMSPLTGVDVLLTTLIETADEENGRFTDRVQEIRQAVKQINAADPAVKELSRLSDKLRRMAAQLLRPAPTDAADAPYAVNSPLAIGLAGCLWQWANEEDGILTRRLNELSGPAKPVMGVTYVILKPTELQLEITIANPETDVFFDDFCLKMRNASVTCSEFNFPCVADPDRPTDGLFLDAQQSYTFRLRVFFEEERETAVKQLFQREQPAKLSLPVRYLRPPSSWIETTLTESFTIQPIAQTTLDYPRELPRAWQTVQPQLKQAMSSRSFSLIHIECTAFARDSILPFLKQQAPAHAPKPVIDLRRWLYEREYIGQEEEQISHDALLHWLILKLNGADEAGVSHYRMAAPRQVFHQIGRGSHAPKLIIFNNWDRFLINLARRHDNLNGLTNVLSFLQKWAAANEIRLVFIGSYLSGRITRRLWPQLTAAMQVVRCNPINLEDAAAKEQLERAIGRILQERGLTDLFAKFPGTANVRELVRLCGGFLHFLDGVAIPALTRLQEDAPTHFPPLQKALVDYVNETNFFSMLWQWQTFGERLALLLAANGEIPILEKNWVQTGMLLSRSYHARRPSGALVKAVTLPANRRLDHNDVQRIRSNIHFRRSDVWIRGFNPQRPALPEWGDTGVLLVNLLRALNGKEVMSSLARSGLLYQRRAPKLGNYFDVAVPLYRGWLARTDAWAHILQAAQEAALPWYPSGLAQDRRPGVAQPGVLFAGREARAAYADVPLHRLPVIDGELSVRTRPLFLNLYGLQASDARKAHARWNSLVKLAQAVNDWLAVAGDADGAEEIIRRLFEGLGELFDLNYQTHPEEERPSGALPIYANSHFHQNGTAVPWVVAELSGDSHALRKQVLWLVVRSRSNLDMSQLHQWARNKVGELHRKNEPDLGEAAYTEAMERSIVFILSLAGKQSDERQRLDQGGPHMIFLDAGAVADMVVQPTPLKSLVSYAYGMTGRHCFTPYKLFGSLDGGSNLFVGRGNELQIILSTLDKENHAILGSRRIGKTSLLREIEYRLNKQGNGRTPLTLLLRLQDNSHDTDLYNQIRWALEDKGLSKIARPLSRPPQPGYEALRDVMHQLYRQTNHPVILLMDEVDGLYFWDQSHNQERLFQFLRNDLAQSTPRLSTLIMTGFRHIYLNRLAHGSVFYNFCRFHNLAGVEPDAINRLAYLLKEFNIEFDDEPDVINLIATGTYAIPYFAQRVCDRLLQSADRKQPRADGSIWIGPPDVEAVLAGDIQGLLKQELWNELNVDPLLNMTAKGRSQDAGTQTKKLKAALLAVILSRYEHLAMVDYAFSLPGTRPFVFTTADALSDLEGFYPGQSVIAEPELERLFQSLTMTLALAPADEARWAYYFPNNILPHVLFFYERHGRADLIAELDDLMQAL